MDWNEVIRIFIIMWGSYLIVDSISRSISKSMQGRKWKKRIVIYERKGKDKNDRL
nr:MAG TPA: hypothetical protein [Caudoviricetes sp.]